MRTEKALFLCLIILAVVLQSPLAMGNPESCELHTFNASSITVIAGTLNDGNLASTYAVDGDWYNVSEIHGPPGLDIRFNFTDIEGDIICGCVDIYEIYSGHSPHEIRVEAWNFTSLSWIKISEILFNETANFHCIGISHYAEHILNSGDIWLRFYHETIGHPPHELKIDSINLSVVYEVDCPSLGKFYALAIILLILGLLLGLGMRTR